MLKFFRTLRYRLMDKNKTAQYFKYAIGEILLVVFGILIALQINNWNEGRKERQQLRTALISVYSDLVSDSVLVAQRLPFVQDRKAEIDILIKRAYATETTLDTLVQMMKYDFPVRWYSSTTFNTNTFSNLKATSTFDILPLPIKKSLSDYYTKAEQNEKLIEKALDQYRIHLDDFVKKYNVIGRLYDDNYENSYLYNHTWEDIDSKDFTPRVAVILAGYRVLFNSAETELVTAQQGIRKILPLLQPYLSVHN